MKAQLFWWIDQAPAPTDHTIEILAMGCHYRMVQNRRKKPHRVREYSSRSAFHPYARLHILCVPLLEKDQRATLRESLGEGVDRSFEMIDVPSECAFDDFVAQPLIESFEGNQNTQRAESDPRAPFPSTQRYKNISRDLAVLGHEGNGHLP